MSHAVTTHRPQQGRPGNTTTLSLTHAVEAVKGRLRRPLRGFALDCPASAHGYRLVMWCRPSSALLLPAYVGAVADLHDKTWAGRNGAFGRNLDSARAVVRLMR